MAQPPMLRNIFLLIFLIGNIPFLHAIEMAITVDDLPLNGTLPNNTTLEDITLNFISTFNQEKISGVPGFIIGTEITRDPKGLKVLHTWAKNGHTIENHTFSHANLAEQPSHWYVDDILRNERYVTYFMPKNSAKYFRFPYLSEGNTTEKRNALRNFLTDRGYTLAPASLFFSDWLWAEPYVRCVNQHNHAAIKWLEDSYLAIALDTLDVYNQFSHYVVGREIKYILLVHFNAFSSVMLPKLLSAYQTQKGVKFIPINQALEDPIYQINPNVTYKQEYPDFLVQVAHEKRLPVPQYMYDIDAKIPREKLQAICR